MNIFQKSLTACFALIVSIPAVQANADTYGHIQEMALDVMIKSDRLMGETHHYVHTPNYHTMLRNVASMKRKAVRVHLLSIQHGCLFEMSRELAELDSFYHYVEGIFDSTEIAASHGAGHVHSSTGHVKDLLKAIEGDIHHIRDDIATMQRPVVVTRPAYRPAYQRPVYQPAPRSSHGYGNSAYRGSSHRGSGHRSSGHRGSGHRSSRGGISYSDDKFSIRLGF